MPGQFPAAFAALKSILEPYAGDLVVKTSSDADYYLETAHICKNKQPLFFAAVNTSKSYVSFHRMPIYICPSLAGDVSVALSKRRQGKACFNFKDTDTILFEELKQLTTASFDYYKEQGLLHAS